MESDDEGRDRSRRRRRDFPLGPWPFGDIDDIMRYIESAFAEQFDELEKELPKGLIRERRHPDGRTEKEIGPIVYGYSVTIGPDGKPVIREFGNVRRGKGTPLKQIQDRREPLVDVLRKGKEVKVIVELPGVGKEDIDVVATERSLSISVDTPERKYAKELALPGPVDPKAARSTYNNGVLEVSLPLKSAGGHGVKLKVG